MAISGTIARRVLVGKGFTFVVVGTPFQQQLESSF
jgi:hypothetical protein